MNRLFEAAAEIQASLVREKIPFCFIGGIANIRWGVIARHKKQLDIGYILRTFTPLAELKGDLSLVTRLRGLLKME